MNGYLKFHPRSKVFSPTDKCLQGFQAFEFYPNEIVEPGSFDKFEFAAVGGGVIDLNTVIGLPCAPKNDLGGQANSDTLPRRRRSCWFRPTVR